MAIHGMCPMKFAMMWRVDGRRRNETAVGRRTVDMYNRRADSSYGSGQAVGGKNRIQFFSLEKGLIVHHRMSLHRAAGWREQSNSGRNEDIYSEGCRSWWRSRGMRRVPQTTLFIVRRVRIQLEYFADPSLLHNNAHQFVRRLIMNDLMRYSESGEKYL